MKGVNRCSYVSRKQTKGAGHVFAIYDNRRRGVDMSYSVAMLSVHTSPLDIPGRTRDAGGMNVYINQLARELGQSKITIDIFTRRTNNYSPHIVQLTPYVRVIHIQAGPPAPIHKHELY